MVLFALIALVAVGGLTFTLMDSITGNYVRSGGGRWHYGSQLAQFQPDEACVYAGYAPADKWRVETNEWGTLVSVCRNGERVPLVQTVVVR